MKITIRLAPPIAGALLIAACSGESDADTGVAEVATSEASTTDPPATDLPATDPPAAEVAEERGDAPEATGVDEQEDAQADGRASAQDIVEALADDELMG
ncbi:MAG: hypothetical protein ACJAXA_000280 [Candidatus Aldehydirespiratoraceae bacterium]|jgi:hypothetical protein